MNVTASVLLGAFYTFDFQYIPLFHCQFFLLYLWKNKCLIQTNKNMWYSYKLSIRPRISNLPLDPNISKPSTVRKTLSNLLWHLATSFSTCLIRVPQRSINVRQTTEQFRTGKTYIVMGRTCLKVRESRFKPSHYL